MDAYIIHISEKWQKPCAQTWFTIVGSASLCLRALEWDGVVFTLGFEVLWTNYNAVILILIVYNVYSCNVIIQKEINFARCWRIDLAPIGA